MLTFTEKQLKTIAKEAVLLSKEKPQIKHSDMLEIISKSLGYRDYNALSIQLKTPNESRKNGTDETTKLIHSEPMSELIKRVNEELKAEYPNIDEKLFVTMSENDHYEHLIYGVFNGEAWTYDFLIRLKESTTKRVLYSPKYKAFSLFVYPNVKDAHSDYSIPIGDISDQNLYRNYFNTVQHLQEKSWMTRELFDDLMNLMRWIAVNRHKIDAYYNSLNEDEIVEIYHNNHE